MEECGHANIYNNPNRSILHLCFYVRLHEFVVIGQAYPYSQALSARK